MKNRNKKKFGGIFLAVLVAFILLAGAKDALAGRAALSWTAPTTNSDNSPLTDLGGYKIYWGTSARTGNSAPGGYSGTPITAGNVTSYTVDNISDTGTTYFSVVAYDTSNNESTFSNEGHKTPGDVDKNGTVNIFDYNTLKGNFGQTNCDNAADIDLNCNVNIFDYNALKGNFGANI